MWNKRSDAPEGVVVHAHRVWLQAAVEKREDNARAMRQAAAHNGGSFSSQQSPLVPLFASQGDQRLMKHSMSLLATRAMVWD